MLFFLHGVKMGYRNALFFCPYLCTRNPDGTLNGCLRVASYFFIEIIKSFYNYDESD